MTRIGMPVANARPIELSLVLFYIPRHVVCCDCIAIVWIAMGLVGLYEQRKQFLCVWQLWVVQYQLQWVPLPLALVPCMPLSVFVSWLGRPRLVREVVSVHPFDVVLWLYNRTSCMILLLLLRLDRVWLFCRGWLSFECLFNVFRLSSTIRPTLNQDSSYFPEAVTLLVLYSTARCVLRL